MYHIIVLLYELHRQQLNRMKRLNKVLKRLKVLTELTIFSSLIGCITPGKL